MLRLRKQLGFTQHAVQSRKAVFVRKEVSSDLVKEDVRYLQIMLFKVEADWSYAMMLKQRSTMKNAKFNTTRARVHAIKRFKRASQSAGSLFREDLDPLSQLEVEAYQLQIKASYSMEVHHFEEALDDLLKAKFIYEKIQSTKDELDAAIYVERQQHIDTFVRLC
jgi:hypothetical protein